MNNEELNKGLLEGDNTAVVNEPKKSFRDCIYGNIDVSLKTMDRFIVAIVFLLAMSIILGIIIK